MKDMVMMMKKKHWGGIPCYGKNFLQKPGGLDSWGENKVILTKRKGPNFSGGKGFIIEKPTEERGEREKEIQGGNM